MTAHEEDDDNRVYAVVVNHEEQYSIWPTDQELPTGWRAEGTTGSKDSCLGHIETVWTDLRPLSLRLFMEEQARRPTDDEPPAEEQEEPEEPSLLDRLSSGDHPVEPGLRPERTALALRESLERGYVLVRFTDTRGGSEIGVTVDPEATDASAADFDAGAGTLHLVGDLILDFESARCHVDIDLATLQGRGRLERTAAAGQLLT
ncbi:MbtH family protein [Kitasatospora sp. NPDC101235]|uniref:MbtH family protein n=1 Tax=Kitasatospora sp. NPDC101235 TaxID=3364101 RepID=UPI0038231901